MTFALSMRPISLKNLFVHETAKTLFRSIGCYDYLGGLFHLDKGLIYPTQERIAKLNLAIENLLTQEKASAFIETAKTLFRSIGCYDYRRFLEIEKIGLSACSLNLTTK
jgi:hypothetical protein